MYYVVANAFQKLLDQNNNLETISGLIDKETINLRKDLTNIGLTYRVNEGILYNFREDLDLNKIKILTNKHVEELITHITRALKLIEGMMPKVIEVKQLLPDNKSANIIKLYNELEKAKNKYEELLAELTRFKQLNDENKHNAKFEFDLIRETIKGIIRYEIIFLIDKITK